MKEFSLSKVVWELWYLGSAQWVALHMLVKSNACDTEALGQVKTPKVACHGTATHL